jgi:hypothetical protein
LATSVPGEGLFRAYRARVHSFALRYLVDANVLSEPTKPEPNLRVVEWLRGNERDLTVGFGFAALGSWLL